MVRSSEDHVGQRGGSDGDGIAIFTSSNIWIDHCFLASCTDGLIDVIHASTSITISNNYFTKHDKVSRTNFNLSISLFDHTHTHALLLIKLNPVSKSDLDEVVFLKKKCVWG